MFKLVNPKHEDQSPVHNNSLYQSSLVSLQGRNMQTVGLFIFISSKVFL